MGVSKGGEDGGEDGRVPEQSSVPRNLVSALTAELRSFSWMEADIPVTFRSERSLLTKMRHEGAHEAARRYPVAGQDFPGRADLLGLHRHHLNSVLDK